MSVNQTTLQNLGTTKISKSEISPSRAYVESPNVHPSSMDVLKQFQANMTTLEDLNGRLQFMMSEIRGLIRK
jgi:hypothetical protein